MEPSPIPSPSGSIQYMPESLYSGRPLSRASWHDLGEKLTGATATAAAFASSGTIDSSRLICCFSQTISLAALSSRNSWSTSLASIPSSRDRSNASCTLSRKKIQSNSVLHKCYNKWNQFGALIMALSIIMRMVLLWKWNTSMSYIFMVDDGLDYFLLGISSTRRRRNNQNGTRQEN